MKIPKIRKIIFDNKTYIFLITFFVLNMFFRVYQLEQRAQFTWDQVDTAWHAKNMIVNHNFPLVGMPAKQNSGIAIGPAYYYFVAIFYLLTNLDPIASPIIASIVSVFSFFVLFLCVRKLFGTIPAFIALFINCFSFYLILQDRIQWPVALIAPIGLLIFLSLYEIFKGNLKYIFLLAVLVGISFHIHFTSIFYIPIIILSFPFFPRKKQTVYFIVYSLPLFAVWLIPFIISMFQKSQSLNLYAFFRQNSVGFHLRRVIQVADIAFLEQTLIWGTKFIDLIKYISIPLFLIIYYVSDKRKDIPLLYLTLIWFLVPWLALSMFQGDLTPYYFAMTRYVAIALISYLLFRIGKYNRKIFIPILIFIGLAFVIWNIIQFATYKTEGLTQLKKIANNSFTKSMGNEFTYGAAQTYLYYFYEWRAYGKK